uniref:Sphingosine-1-phosphate phosphatase 2 n=1 Tax=Sinocyclocheilus grahami TaxID=75366 RepID=A0A672NE51_SINGR
MQTFENVFQSASFRKWSCYRLSINSKKSEIMKMATSCACIICIHSIEMHMWRYLKKKNFLQSDIANYWPGMHNTANSYCTFFLRVYYQQQYLFCISPLPNFHQIFLSLSLQVVMYIGQVMKDILKLPRPPSPPVVKLETRVDAEYGMPSTHAMAATAISFTLLLSAQERVKFPFELGLIVAVVLSALVCLSRLYTGMHSALDVICGVVISAVIMAVSYPYWGTIDYLQLHNPLSPVVGVVLPLFLSYKYPELDHYSTTRGDTTVILACCSGCSVGYWVNERLGLTFDLAGPFPVTLPPLTLAALGLGVARFLVGLGMLVLTRQTVRWASLRVLCRINGASVNDVEARRRKEIEVPYKFSTYVAIGLVNSILVNRVYVMMGLWDLGNSV